MIFLSDSGVDGCGCIIVGNGFQTYFVLLVYEGRMQHRKPGQKIMCRKGHVFLGTVYGAEV